MNGVKRKGCEFRVDYVVYNSDERFRIVDNPQVSWDDVMKTITNFDITYVPKFGKFEIEQFVGHYMKQALLITKDITELFCMDLICDDFPYNVTKVSMNTLRKRLLQCFNVVKKEGNFTYLMFKWEKIS